MNPFRSDHQPESDRLLFAGFRLSEPETDPHEADSLLGPDAVGQVVAIEHEGGAGVSGESELLRGFRLGNATAPSAAFDLSRISAPFGTGDAGEADPAEDELSRAGSPAPGPAFAFPEPGATFGGFRLLTELGRGAFARVFLAEQADLGHRLVALKVSRAEGDEPRLLARLQHTHIVPIFSLHDDPATNLRLICMPYLGGNNLARVLDAVGARGPSDLSGRSLIDALDRMSSQAPGSLALVVPSIPTCSRPTSGRGPAGLRTDPGDGPSGPHARRSGRLRSVLRALPFARSLRTEPTRPAVEDDVGQPARRFLRSATSIQAAVWITARLAEGLEHAHSRGLLHRDLKPSNILITADGTPMLLDFNLSTELVPTDRERGAPALLGGTLPFMSPEHLAAFHPQSDGDASAVTERSDLYALGLILYEMIAGRHPFDEPPPNLPLLELIALLRQQRSQVPSLRAARPEAPWSLDAIVAKCLDPDPAQRYARAGDLADDLRRFLDDLPLKFAPEPSLRERAAKWVRRHPQARNSTTLSLLAIALLMAVGSLAVGLSRNNRDLAARVQLQAFQGDFNECRLLLNVASGPEFHLAPGLARAERALNELAIERSGVWALGSWVRRLPADERRLVADEAAELILLTARTRAYRAQRGGSEGDQRAALEWAVTWLDRAERLAPRTIPALLGDRARYLGALGRADEAARDREQEAHTPLTTGRDFGLLGTSLLARGELDRAEEALGHATVLDPRAFWDWFALGLCHFQQGRPLEAAGDFGVCTVLEPKFAWPAFNRGLALARAGRLADARSCYDRALERNPNFVEALVNRAAVALQLDDLDQAERDLDRAVTALGSNDATTLAALGEVLARRGRRVEAETLYARRLARRPDDVATLVARGIFRLGHDPAGARADLSRARALQPRDARALYGLARLSYPADLPTALDLALAARSAEPDFHDAIELCALIRARRGDLAAVDDVDLLLASPTPHRLYNAATALALLSRSAAEPRLAPRALALLRRALDAGFPAREAAIDPDWQPFCKDQVFRSWIGSSPGRGAATQ